MLRTSAWRGWRQCLPRPLRLAMASTRLGLGDRPWSAATARCSTSTLSRRGGSLSDRDPPAVEKNVVEGNPTSEVSKSEAKLLTALRAYKDEYGDLLVPSSFAVPSGDAAWPSMIWGYKLGSAVNTLRQKLKRDSHGLSAEMKQELDDMHFVWDVSQYRWDQIILPSLQRFYEVNGHTDIPIHFVVPTGDETWPKVAWGKALGHMVTPVRGGETYAVQVAQSEEELVRLQYCFKTSIAERDWTEKILPSLRVHRQEFGHCIVPKDFTVPASPPWPEKAWGMPLGVAVCDLRRERTYIEQVARDKDILEGLGFAWNRSAAVWNEEIIPALEVFAEVCKGRQLRQSFVVPSEDPWPSRAWGMSLGRTFADLRRKGTYFAHYGRDLEKLEELGVNMKLSVAAWKLRVVPLLEIYATLYGDQEVPEQFVIPSETPWPEELWGVRLGLIVARNSRHMKRG